MNRMLRFCVAIIVLGALAAVVALAIPAAKPASPWEEARVDHEPLSSSKVSRHARRNANAAAPSVEVLAAYPHDAAAFTQGLLVAQQGDEKFFIESTGLYGQSTLRKVEIATGKILAKYDLDSNIFGEGVTLGPDGELVLVTWKEKRGYTFNLTPASGSKGRAVDARFDVTSTFPFDSFTGEGWGIDFDGTHLVVSDGSSKIIFWDSATKTHVREITVTFNGEEVPYINELEVANGFIYANIWFQTVIVKIDPTNGKVVAVFDCSSLMEQSGATPGDTNAVLNGIAYDGDEDVFYITGKLWGRVFKVRLIE